MQLTDAEVIALATLFETPIESITKAMTSQEISSAVARVIARANDVIHESRATRR